MPEAVGQIVVLDGRQALDRSVAAVVVGNQQSFRGDELGRAAVVEEHDGVFERSLVDAVNVFRSQLESFGAHIVDARRDQARQPHALIGECRERKQREAESRKDTFHGLFFID